MTLLSAKKIDPGEWLESGAAKLMDIAFGFDTIVQKLDTIVDQERGSRYVLQIASCSFRMKDLGIKYANTKHQLDIALQTEAGLIWAYSFLNSQHSDLMALLEGRDRAEALEDACLAGDEDRAMAIQRETRQLLEATNFLGQAVLAYTQHLEVMIQRVNSCACQLTGFMNGFDNLLEEMDEFLQLLGHAGNSE